MKSTEHYLKELKHFTNPISKFLKQNPKSGQQTQIKPIFLPMFIMHGRCRSLYSGVILLNDNSQPEEANILCRSLVEESLRMIEIANSNNKVSLEYLAGWFEMSLNNKINVLGRIRKQTEETKKRITDFKKQEKDKIDNLIKEHDINSTRYFPSTDKLLNKYMDEHDFGYSLFHQMTHGYELSQSFRSLAETDDKGNSIHHLHVKRDNALLELINLHLSMKALLDSYICASRFITLSNVDDCKTIRDNLIKFAESIPNST